MLQLLRRTEDPMEATKQAAAAFNERLAGIRGRTSPRNGRPWYPYGSIGNIWFLDQLLTGEDRALFSDLRGKAVADIGAADGDMGLFLSTLGAEVDLIDNPPTNMNGFQGAETLKAELGSTATLHAVDLDSQFHLPRNYDFALFLGILYHLKNPFYVLERLAKHTQRCLVSTRIARYAPSGIELATAPVAYLVGPQECNNDASNYWIFSLVGLLRLCERAGWTVVACKTFGDSAASNPADNDHDERAFLLLSH